MVTRGWTLQELLAPRNLIFLNREWSEIGSKSTMSNLLSQITGIDEETLQGESLRRVSIAKRMSRASERQTTRTEDIAYSLFGIFDVNMPLIYGEGHKAFIRLHEEIMRDSSDQSLFAWKASKASGFNRRGILAQSPLEFRESGNVISYPGHSTYEAYSFTNLGLGIKMRLLESTIKQHALTGLLHCFREECPQRPLEISLAPLGPGTKVFARDNPDKLSSCKNPVQATAQIIYIKKHLMEEGPSKSNFGRDDSSLDVLIDIVGNMPLGYDFNNVRAIAWDPSSGIVGFVWSPKDPSVAAFQFTKTGSSILVVILGFDGDDYRMWGNILSHVSGIDEAVRLSRSKFKNGFQKRLTDAIVKLQFSTEQADGYPFGIQVTRIVFESL